ncbi:MAG: sortase [Candidatus Dojkabacteria bacterium]
MKNRGLIAVFTLLALILSASTLWLITNLKSPQTKSSVLGTATESDLKVESNIDYIHSNSDGSSEIRYIYTFTNISSIYNLISITGQSDLSATFSPHPFQVLSLTSDKLTINPSYNGLSNKELLTDGNLDIGENGHIYLIVKFYPEGSVGPFNNRVTSTADITLPSTGSTTGATGGSTTGGGSSTGTPPTTSTTTTTTGTGGTTGATGTTTGSTTGTTTGGTTVTGGTGGTTDTPEPPPSPTGGSTSTSTTTTTTGGGTGATTGASTTGGTTGATTGATTGGTDPDTIAAAQVSFTLTASGGVGSITQLPGTSVLPIHFGIISNISEWIKDNIIHEDRNKLVINNIGVNGEVFEGDQTALNQGFWRLPESSAPDKTGNTVIAGHRFTYNYGPYTFYNLNELNKGDSISIKWNDKTYTYKVTTIKIVDSTDTSVLNQTDKSTLTLITCTSWDLNEPRLIVQAELQ